MKKEQRAREREREREEEAQNKVVAICILSLQTKTKKEMDKATVNDMCQKRPFSKKMSWIQEIVTNAKLRDWN